MRFIELRAISEHDESLSNVTFNSLLLNSDDVESHGLGEWSALADSDDVSNLGSTEAWSAMSWEVVMSLFESIVFLDIMKVISSKNDGSAHFGGKDDTPKVKLRKTLGTYLKILPLMETSEVNGHFLSTYWASMADCGVLKPKECLILQNYTYRVRSSCSIWVQQRSSS